MGTAATGRQYRISTPIEPGDTQLDVLIFVPSGCPAPPRARVVVQREGEAPIQDEVVVTEVVGAAA